jgi:hypothetical protein
MPAVSKAEQSAMAIAEHHPDKLYARNRGLLKMTHQQLHDFAATPRRGLPDHVSKKKRGKARSAAARRLASEMGGKP